MTWILVGVIALAALLGMPLFVILGGIALLCFHAAEISTSVVAIAVALRSPRGPSSRAISPTSSPAPTSATL